MSSPIDLYLQEIRRCLRWHPVLARRVTTEVADHLAQATAEEMRAGSTRREAEETAVRRFGPASVVAGKYQQVASTHGGLVIAMSCATACVAIWLMFVTFVLPRDPGTLLVWRSLAAAFMVYSVLTVGCIVSGADRPALRWSVGWLSMAAVVLGSLHVGSTLLLPGDGRHIEGYVLLVGTILFAHGLLALSYLVHNSGPHDAPWQANR